MRSEDDAESSRRRGNYDKLQNFREEMFQLLSVDAENHISKIRDIHQNNVIPYENTDDEYCKKLHGLYKGWAGIGDVIRDNRNERLDFYRGVLTAVIDTIAGVAGLLWTLTEMPLYPVLELIGIVPKWMQKDMDRFNQGITLILTDPGQAAEAIGQNIFDTADEEGGAFSLGYVIVDIALEIFVDKGLKKLKAAKVADNVVDAVEDLVKHADGVADTAEDLVKYANGVGSTAEDLVRHADGVADTAEDLVKYANGVGSTAEDLVRHADGVADTAEDLVKYANGVESTAEDLARHADGVADTAEDLVKYANGVGSTAEDLVKHADDADGIPREVGRQIIDGDLDTSIQSKLEDLLNSDYYKYDPGYDCSEIAEDFYNVAGNQGNIYRIEGKNGIINGFEYDDILEFDYHEVYSDGINIYDPRYRNEAIPKDDYFRALKEINPDGFDVFTIK